MFQRLGAAVKACCAFIVHGVDILCAVAIVTLTAIGMWSEPWGPAVVTAGLFALPLVAWVLWKRRRRRG